MSSIICALLIIMSNGILLAYHSEQVSEVHTWHTITSFNGSWYGSLHVLTDNEQGVYFIDGTANHSRIENPFTVSESASFDYGLVITEQDDFNMLYSLTLSQQLEPDPKQSNSRICVFLISAERAACPYIVPVSFHGKTTCLWESVEGRGENFWIQ
ncbi:unnamed protein product [Adineta ricciae]|uniref:Uncharacterized protein n=1 Tax=Adineta ricciae TaxID=249248 RepID=A0A816AE42_ADIRI|nr:unnamed protein product [Adineta ricciae]CAF1596453.1 unnamed protein product [Adineta ricciae]